jgi:four helix bundle protein
MTNDEIEDAFWNDDRESCVVHEDPVSTTQPAYDLEERTARFGEALIDFANIIPRTPVTRRLIEQLVGCGTSVGANYCEADDAVSKKEFRLRCGTCKKEARETKYFLRMVVRAVPELKPQARPIWQEAKELHLIFAKIWRSAE